MRETKVHFAPNPHKDHTRCGIPGRTTYVHSAVTCKGCMFGILADAAPWAPAFLNGLRLERAP